MEDFEWRETIHPLSRGPARSSAVRLRSGAPVPEKSWTAACSRLSGRNRRASVDGWTESQSKSATETEKHGQFRLVPLKECSSNKTDLQNSFQTLRDSSLNVETSYQTNRAPRSTF